MNTHDEFAAAALNALIARQTTNIETAPAHRAIAKMAYDLADAMMTERQNRMSTKTKNPNICLEPSISEQRKWGVTD